jgi:hypothetical protein
VDLDQAPDPADDNNGWYPYAIVVSNTDDTHTANVTVEKKAAGAWTTVETHAVLPNGLYTFTITDDAHVEDSGIGGAFRVSSDFPIVAYQFNPIDTAERWSNDASMLLPKHTLDQWSYVASWTTLQIGILVTFYYRSYFAVVATADGTRVTVVPTVDALGSGSIPYISPGTPYEATLDEGEFLEIAAANGDLTGTYVEATAPVAVFGGNECADVPYDCDWCRNARGTAPGSMHGANRCAWCDHVEEQVFPLTTWGVRFVAARVPVRSVDGLMEGTFWRVIASEEVTVVDVATSGTVRLPPGVTLPAVIGRPGEHLDFELVGTDPGHDPGDSFVEADKPVLVVQYMEGQECTNRGEAEGGDPSMILTVPIEQYQNEYILLTPDTYDIDYLVLTRPPGATITVDGAAVADAEFVDVPGTYQVARVVVTDGVHHLSGTAPFGVIVVGYSPYVSYSIAPQDLR